MAPTIRIKMIGEEVDLEVSDDEVTESSIRHAFLLPSDAVVSLSYEVDGLRIRCRVNDAGSRFLLPDGWSHMLFLVDSDKVPSRPTTPMDQAMNERPISPYYPALVPRPAPTSEAFVKWMFFLEDEMGKATAICVHPHFFVTFRHGTHLELKLDDKLTIYSAEEEAKDQTGISVRVVKVNETFDFVLLKSEVDVVERGPSIAQAQGSEPFTLAGFGNELGGLSYLPGAIHSVRNYYFSGSQSSMGPFILGTGRSSRGDSGAGIWGSRGLIGMNIGCTVMPLTSHHSAISEAATFSAKNIICPASRFQEAYMEELEKEHRKEKLKSPPMKKINLMADFDGLGSFSGSSV